MDPTCPPSRPHVSAPRVERRVRNLHVYADDRPRRSARARSTTRGQRHTHHPDDRRFVVHVDAGVVDEVVRSAVTLPMGNLRQDEPLRKRRVRHVDLPIGRVTAERAEAYGLDYQKWYASYQAALRVDL